MSNKTLLNLLKTRQNHLLKEAQQYNWGAQARSAQRIPQGNWRVWLILAGRGFGKTRTGAESIRAWVQQGLCRRLALIGETEADTRRVMVEGDSGILRVHPLKERPLYKSSCQEILWPNGAKAMCFSGDAYEQLRGPQFDGAWVDELAKFKSPKAVWDQLMFGLRLGRWPRAIVTTTPRPIKLLKDLLKSPDVVVTKGSTFENMKNLSGAFLSYIRQHYANTRLGRQELYADVIEDCQDALWSRALIEKAKEAYQEGPLDRVVIAMDPAVSSGKNSDETGIIVAGLTQQGKGVVLEDLSLKATPYVWARRAIEAYHRLKADRIVAEVNIGGDLVEQVLRSVDPSVSYKAVHAQRGKAFRAEPVAALYEQGKVWHACGLSKLEEQLCTYVPGKKLSSPDRLDALVWALSELMLKVRCHYKIWAT